MVLDPDRYVIGDDGLVVEKVGPWGPTPGPTSAYSQATRSANQAASVRWVSPHNASEATSCTSLSVK
jgi:hypothetical protein